MKTTGKSSFYLDRTISIVLAVSLVVSIFTTLFVIYLLGKESYQFFSMVPLTDFLFGTRWEPLLEPKSFGVLPLVLGTMQIVVGSIIIALPFGLLVAVYLSEFASERMRGIVKPVLEVLAGIPTVVYGYFALSFITPLLRTIFPDINIFNAMSGAIVVGIMILPMITSLCDDAFRAVPGTLREGGYAVGACTFEVVLHIILPAAAPRVGAAVVLAVSRAIGETMAVTLAAGATPNIEWNPLESIQTMTAFIVQVSLGDTPQGGVEYLSAFAVGSLLFLMTLVMNAIGTHLIFKNQKNRETV